MSWGVEAVNDWRKKLIFLPNDSVIEVDVGLCKTVFPQRIRTVGRNDPCAKRAVSRNDSDITRCRSILHVAFFALVLGRGLHIVWSQTVDEWGGVSRDVGEAVSAGTVFATHG